MSPINGIDKLPKQGLMKIAMTQNKIVENMTNLKLKKEKDNEKDISIVFLIDQVVCVWYTSIKSYYYCQIFLNILSLLPIQP